MKWEKVKEEQREGRGKIELRLNHFPSCSWSNTPSQKHLKSKNSFLPFSPERSPALDANPPSASLHHEKELRRVPHSSTVVLRNVSS